MNRQSLSLVLLGVLIGSLPLAADDAAGTGDAQAEEEQQFKGVHLDSVTIHGFGGWAVGDTDGNRYLFGAEGRGYDDRSFALNVTAQPSEELRISFQSIFEPPANNPETVEAGLDYAFAEWTVSETFKFRGGVAKTPFGIYSEIFDVGTIRPFFDLPQGMYGPSEVVAKSYFGFGVTGTTGTNWELQYDVYGGEMELDAVQVGNPLLFASGEEGGGSEGKGVVQRIALSGGEEEGEGGEEATKLIDMLGARILITTPVSGLSFGVSGFGGVPEVEGAEAAIPPRQEVYGFHVEYLDETWSVRSEVAHREGGKRNAEVDAFYVEVGYRINPRWQVASRFDKADMEVTAVPVRAPSLLEHEDLAWTVNYWLSPELVFKLSFHDVEGNLFAIPGRNPEVIEKRGLSPTTDLVKLGLQFSF